MKYITEGTIKSSIESALTKSIGVRAWAIKELVETLNGFFDNFYDTGPMTYINNIQRMLPAVNKRDAEVIWERYLPHFEKNMSSATEDLLNGEIIPREWGDILLQEIQYLYLTGMAASVGGVQNISVEMLDDVDKLIQKQTTYINRFVASLTDDVRVDKQTDLSRIMRRVMLYPNSSMEIIERAFNRKNDLPELPFFPKVGTNCFNHCHCEWQWDESDSENGNFTVRWSLAPDVEHCEICLRRAEVCSPLRYENWEITTNLNLKELIRG